MPYEQECIDSHLSIAVGANIAGFLTCMHCQNIEITL